MREQLIRYVDLLFAGAPNAQDVKQEILQNTLDRYDDLLQQGKSPEAAYSLAISGIGDISEILGSSAEQIPAVQSPHLDPAQGSNVRAVPAWKKALRAVAVCLYILCPTPLFVMSEYGMETIGLCGTLSIVAVATALMVIAGGNKSEKKAAPEPQILTPQQELHKAVKTIITTVGLLVYFVLSFLTQAWWITWLVFPIMAAVKGLVRACMDLKEASKHEN